MDQNAKTVIKFALIVIKKQRILADLTIHHTRLPVIIGSVPYPSGYKTQLSYVVFGRSDSNNQDLSSPCYISIYTSGSDNALKLWILDNPDGSASLLKYRQGLSRYGDLSSSQLVGQYPAEEKKGSSSSATAAGSSVKVSSCGNFAVIGYANGLIAKFNIQSGLQRGQFDDGKWSAKNVVRKVLMPMFYDY
eukprot:gene9429-10240_t